MKITETKELSAGTYQCTLVADAAEFEAAQEAVYQEKKATYTTEGYEVGNVPRDVMEEKEGAVFLQYDAVNNLLTEKADACFIEAVSEQGLMPLNPPAYELTKCDADGFVAQLTFGVLPEVTLGEYKGLTLEYPAVEMPKDAVEHQLAYRRRHLAAQEGHPEELPALDDAFAQKISDCETLDQLRGKMQESLDALFAEQSKQQGQFMLMEQIGAGSTVEIPEILLQYEYEVGMRHLMQNLHQHGVKIEDHLKRIGKTQEEFDAMNQRGAVQALRAKLSVYTIASQENIVVTEEEVEAELARVAARNHITVEQLSANTPRYMLKNQMLLERTMVFLSEHSTLTCKG